MIDEFRKFDFETEQAIDNWATNLTNEALKQGNYNKAERWLRNKMPELKNSFGATAKDQWIVCVRAIYQDAIYNVQQIAMKQETGVK